MRFLQWISAWLSKWTPLFVSLNAPAGETGLAVFRRNGLWVTTKPVPRTFDAPAGTSVRLDLSWDPQ